MIVGFTGTRKGMTHTQRVQVVNILSGLQPDAFHHGGCVGADAEAHALADRLRIPTVIHTPTDGRFQATLFLARSEIRPPKPYLERNHDIVDESDVLIATPGQVNEVRRSGTWATIRYARKQDKTVLLVLPEE
jgi:hypothetical protein